MFRSRPSPCFVFRPWMVCDTSVEIRELRAFAAVADEGSLSAAARRLHLSQSALSQTIQSLERQLGVQLLLRSRTGVTTTEAGAVLLREGRALIAQYDRMLAAVPGRDGAGPGILKDGHPAGTARRSAARRARGAERHVSADPRGGKSCLERRPGG